MDERVDSLVKFLANPNRKADEHVETVMEMTRELAKYKHELRESRNKERNARNEVAMLRDPFRGQDPYDRLRQPNIIQLPENARAVRIEL